MVDFTAFRNALQYPSLSEMAHDTRIMTAARVLVAYYYYFLAFLSVLFLTSGFLHKVNFDPFWPLSWSSWLEFDFATTVLIVKLFFLAAAFLSLLFHNTWWSRLLIFIAIWQVHALESSFGSMNHHWYGWLYTSLIFVFLPNVWRDESWNTSRTFLLSIWFAQASVALLYTLAGIHKLITALEQFSQNEIHGLSIEGFSYLIADWNLKLQEEAMLASFFIQNPLIGGTLFICNIFFQIFSIWIMVRPSLQKVWAGVMLLFYAGVFLTMGISFHPLLILVLALFLHSPFIPEDNSFSRMVRDLPIIGYILDARRRKMQTSGHQRGI